MTAHPAAGGSEFDDVVLRDGSTLALRPAVKADVPALVDFFSGLSPESRYFRFIGRPKLDRASVERLLPVDPSVDEPWWANRAAIR